MAGPDPGRRAARAGDLCAGAGRRPRHPDPQGAGRQCRSCELARGGCRPRHRRCAEEGAGRRDRRHAQERGLEEGPGRQGLDGPLSLRRRVLEVSCRRERARECDPEDSGPGFVRSMLMERRAAAEIILGLGIAALGAFILYEAQTIRVIPIYAKVGPKDIPILVGAILAALGLALAWQGWRAKPAPRRDPTAVMDAPGSKLDAPG